jgi:3-hydroxyacyl-[acyl-carrier protein] dehydratase/trans-2-decenoyl-[acyl-carrier protein] isomerase
MTYDDFLKRETFNQEELIAFSYGKLVDHPPDHFDARLPAPPFLMIDRVISVEKKGGRGRIVAEQDIRLDAWYFQCHMPGDPVQPGCLCVDAIWQLMGFYCVLRGALGAGRALGCDEIAFNGQIRPFNKVARFEVEVKRYSELKNNGASLIVANGSLAIDGEVVMTVKNARTGVFKGITYNDYPKKSANSIGGIMRERMES